MQHQPNSTVDPGFAADGKVAGLWNRLRGTIAPQWVDPVTAALASIPDPNGAILHLVRLHEAQPQAFHRFTSEKTALRLLLTVFSASRFLADEVIRSPLWISALANDGDLHRAFTLRQYSARLAEQLRGAEVGLPAGFALRLARFRRREILRILVRDRLGYADLATVTAELSALADSILDAAWRAIVSHLALRYGRPTSSSAGEPWRECGLAILALGKHGGAELNYSSDVDLMFVFESVGQTSGATSISNGEFFKKACLLLTEILSTYTPHGICYRIDLRLRPEGGLGEIALSTEAAARYYLNRARDWELQMLIKARPCAGQPAAGHKLLEDAQQRIYASSLNFSQVEAVSEARHRIHEKQSRRKTAKAALDVKLAPGGIRDIEFLVQCLQRLHGGTDAFVRAGGTLLALFRLHDKGFLSAIEYSRLSAAYTFLRHLEHALQNVDDLQTHNVPSADADQGLLARQLSRLPDGPTDAASLRELLERHCGNVRDIYDRVVHAQLPANLALTASTPDDPEPIPASPNLSRLVSQQSPGLAASLRRTPVRRAIRTFEPFLEKVLSTPEWRERLDNDPVLVGYLTDLFDHSTFLADQLNRRPEWIEELIALRTARLSRLHLASQIAGAAGAAELRRSFHRLMFRIQAESVCLRTPVFETLSNASALADAAIRSAYKIAVEETLVSAPPSEEYAPADQMFVIALGRLGLDEFDLGSDADLNFVLPDEDTPHILYWTRVAERLIAILTAYTAEGAMFAVDTRLRPNGREGPLVQSRSAYFEYFTRSAAAWEGISYMKARAVAGTLTTGTRFLAELQDIDWRRYGQTERSRDQLRLMRDRLEQELSAPNPLKAGVGGYYDIDFALMFLRLRGAGMFFPKLNTPERIEIIEKMGHLDRADAQFVRDAALLYRAVDHALRVSTGQAEGKLPASQGALDMTTELVSRWTPDHLHNQPLAEELDQIRGRSRRLFERLFGEAQS